MNKICAQGDNFTISNIDVTRAFINLHMDLADTLKLGIRWRDNVAGAAFQCCSDPVMFIMAKSGAKIYAYIDDYIMVSPRDTAEAQF